ncbi:hypothetical protein WAI453_011330 [Rhynchosporium graminicola]
MALERAARLSLVLTTRNGRSTKMRLSHTLCNKSSDAWPCLQSVSIDPLVNISNKVFADVKLTNPASVFSPVIDSKPFDGSPVQTLEEAGPLTLVPGATISTGGDRRSILLAYWPPKLPFKGSMLVYMSP